MVDKIIKNVGLENCPFCNNPVEMRRNMWKSKINDNYSMYYLAICCGNCSLFMEDLPYDTNTNQNDENSFISKFIKRWNNRTNKFPFSLKKGSKLYYHCYDRVENRRHLCEIPDVVTAVMSEGFFVSPKTNSDGVFKPDEDQFYYWSAIGEEYFLTIQDAEKSMKECEENATTGSD